nr:unnamed protein product [Digitaria exilis]
MGKSTRVRCPSEAAGSASRDGAATARLEKGLTNPLPIAEPGKKQRSATAMRAVAGVYERWRRVWSYGDGDARSCFKLLRRSGDGYLRALGVGDPLGGHGFLGGDGGQGRAAAAE